MNRHPAIIQHRPVYRSGNTASRIVGGLIIVTILVLIIWGLISFFSGKSDGSRVGNITKFSKSGWINKTWEGDLNMGSFATSDDNKSGVFQFTVDDDGMVDKVQAALDSGKKVKITYHKRTVQWPWSGDTKYRVTGVDYVPTLPTSP